MQLLSAARLAGRDVCERAATQGDSRRPGRGAGGVMGPTYLPLQEIPHRWWVIAAAQLSSPLLGPPAQPRTEHLFCSSSTHPATPQLMFKYTPLAGSRWQFCDAAHAKRPMLVMVRKQVAQKQVTRPILYACTPVVTQRNVTTSSRLQTPGSSSLECRTA